MSFASHIHPTRRFRCLNCHKKLDSATATAEKDAQPKPRNLCICIECGHVMVFGDDMWPRKPMLRQRDRSLQRLAGRSSMPTPA
jgi:hypothetical protein